MTVEENIGFPLQVKRLPADEISRQVERDRRGSSISRSCSAAGRPNFRAASSSAWRWPARWCASRTSCCSTSRLPISMQSFGWRCARKSGASSSKPESPPILVTHDQVEAMSMCDRIAIMDAGKIIQIATPSEMYENPRTEFVAGFLGNPPIAFLNGVVGDGAIDISGTDIRLPKSAGALPLVWRACRGRRSGRKISGLRGMCRSKGAFPSWRPRGVRTFMISHFPMAAFCGRSSPCVLMSD